MEEIEQNIKQLISQGENLLKSIPQKSDLKKQKQEIKNRFTLNESVSSIGGEIISEGISDFFSDLIGKRKSKPILRRAIKNRSKIQMMNEINQIDNEYKMLLLNIERQYEGWFNQAQQILKILNYPSYVKKLYDSKQKVKLETKIRWGIKALIETVNYLEKPTKIKKETALIKTGEPLKGRKLLIKFIRNASEFVKIQEPYPTSEILNLIESTKPNIYCKLLLGPFKNQKIREEFEKNLALLRRTGKNIEVLLIEINNGAPFHDRFFISKKKAITTGTSLSGLGMRDSTITYLEEWRDIEKRFDEYIISSKTIHRGKECKRERL